MGLTFPCTAQTTPINSFRKSNNTIALDWYSADFYQRFSPRAASTRHHRRCNVLRIQTAAPSSHKNAHTSRTGSSWKFVFIICPYRRAQKSNNNNSNQYRRRCDTAAAAAAFSRYFLGLSSRQTLCCIGVQPRALLHYSTRANPFHRYARQTRQTSCA